MTRRRGPALIDDLDSLPEAPAGPEDAPEIDAPAAPAIRTAGRPAGILARLFWGALAGLVSLALGLWTWEMVEALFARNLWLGRIALAFAAAAGAALLAMSMRELAALSRIRRADRLRETADRARRSGDRNAALRALEALDRHYAAREEFADTRRAVAREAAELLDPDAMIDMAERRYMASLDAAAEAAATRAARRIAATTALIPMPLIDVLAALAVNLRMIRDIAEIYGGRAGWFGSWRLMRAIAGHLVAAGGLAVGEDLLGPAIGGGALARLSRRFGEGLVNGALTARIGLAAMEACRPLPFSALRRPSLSAVARGAFSGLLLRKV